MVCFLGVSRGNGFRAARFRFFGLGGSALKGCNGLGFRV